MITIYDYFILKIDFLKNNKLLHNQNFKPIILKDKKDVNNLIFYRARAQARCLGHHPISTFHRQHVTL